MLLGGLRQAYIGFAAALVLAAIPSNSSWGQEPGPSEAPDSLSLEQAIGQALAGNIQVLAAAREIEAAEARVLVREGLEPTALFFDQDEISGTRIGQAGTTTLGISQGLPFPGKRGTEVRLARLDLRILESEQRRVRRRLSAEVTEAFFVALFEEERAHRLQISEGLFTTFLETTQARFQAGEAPYLDVIRAKVELSRLRNDFLESRRTLQAAQARLNLLIGGAGSGRVRLLTRLNLHAEDPERDASIARAVEGSATLEIERLRLESARLARTLAAKSRLPDFELHLSTQRVRDGGESVGRWGAGFTLSAPLQWWKAPRGALRESEANLRRQEAGVLAHEREVRTAAELAWEIVATTHEQVRLFETSILDDLESELRTGIDAYRTGRIDALNLVDIHRTYVDSRTEYERTLYLHLAALARLEAAGDLEPSPEEP